MPKNRIVHVPYIIIEHKEQLYPIFRKRYPRIYHITIIKHTLNSYDPYALNDPRK